MQEARMPASKLPHSYQDGSTEVQGRRGHYRPGKAAGVLGGALSGAVCSPECGDECRPGCLAQSPSHRGVGCRALCRGTRKSHRLSPARGPPGRDEIPSEVLKSGKPVLLPHLHKLLCPCWEKGHMLQDMRDANIVTLYKNKEVTTATAITTTASSGKSLPTSSCHT
ncbi:unnamed protein product [Acanthosepion pharaonis]|uniref:Uncharacterized protein n=1 Tax=Acanthosepion pharaonis TaxID=158019 RepID=A0A812BNL2_ACAPH|nr:unnamed protein product [Sepia pharaonis]